MLKMTIHSVWQFFTKFTFVVNILHSNFALKITSGHIFRLLSNFNFNFNWQPRLIRVLMKYTSVLYNTYNRNVPVIDDKRSIISNAFCTNLAYRLKILYSSERVLWAFALLGPFFNIMYMRSAFHSPSIRERPPGSVQLNFHED